MQEYLVPPSKNLLLFSFNDCNSGLQAPETTKLLVFSRGHVSYSPSRALLAGLESDYGNDSARLLLQTCDQFPYSSQRAIKTV